MQLLHCANTQHSPSARHCSWQSQAAGQIAGDNCATHCGCIPRVPTHDALPQMGHRAWRGFFILSQYISMSESLPPKQILTTRDRCWGLLWSHEVLQMYMLPSCVQSRCMHVMSRDGLCHPCICCCPPMLLQALPPGRLQPAPPTWPDVCTH